VSSGGVHCKHFRSHWLHAFITLSLRCRYARDSNEIYYFTVVSCLLCSTFIFSFTTLLMLSGLLIKTSQTGTGVSTVGLFVFVSTTKCSTLFFPNQPIVLSNFSHIQLFRNSENEIKYIILLLEII
jgi:hypothetical protein